MWQQSLKKSVKELRFIFCQQNQQSEGCRNFVLNNYLGVKKDNPDFPFIVRECEGIQPYIIARYSIIQDLIGFGVEKKAFVANLDEHEINDVVKHLVQQAAEVNQQIQK